MNSPVPKMSFDLRQRYGLASSLINAIREGGNLRILDAGSRSGYLQYFLPEDIIINLDINLLPDDAHLVGDVLKLPFQSETLDFTLSLDVLEHIPPSSRRNLWSEMARVSRDCFLIGAPFRNQEVETAEKKVNDFFRQVTGSGNQFLVEHINFGLPELEEVLGWVKQCNYQSIVLPNSYLPRWMLMMCLNAFLSVIPETGELIDTVNSLYIRQFELFDNAFPAYRRLVLVSKTGSLQEDVIRRRFVSPPEPADFQEQQWESLNQIFQTIVASRKRLYFQLTRQLEIERKRYDRVSRELNYIKSTFSYRLFKKTWGRIRDSLN